MMEKRAERNEIMNDYSIEKNIKKENKKAGKLFIVYMILCGIAGGVIGICFFKVSGDITEGYRLFEEFLMANSMIICIALTLFMAVVVLLILLSSITCIKQTKKNAVRFIQTDDEESMCKMDKKLSYNLCITNGATILLCFLFAAIMFTDIRYGSMQIPRISIYGVGVFFIGIFVIIILQQKLVDCCKIINPEKKGSVYDFKFSKIWEESSDEAEKLGIYRAAYKAFQRANMTCLILWAVFVVLGIFSGTGFLPVVTVIIIWGVLTFSYNYYSIKYGK